MLGEGGVRTGEESSEHRHELSLQRLALIGRKGLTFGGFIHCLAARGTASVRKRERNFPKRYTKRKRKGLKGTETAPGRAGSPRRAVAAAFRAQPRISRSSREGIGGRKVALHLPEGRNTPQPPDYAPTKATADSCQHKQKVGSKGKAAA